MEFILSHPSDPTSTATYGADEQGHPWASLEYNGVVVVYDTAEVDYDIERPVVGLLWFLSMFGFLDGDDICAAFENCHDGNFGARLNGWPLRKRRALRRGVRRVIAVISNLESATG